MTRAPCQRPRAQAIGSPDKKSCEHWKQIMPLVGDEVLLVDETAAPVLHARMGRAKHVPTDKGYGRKRYKDRYLV